ncbi:MAG: tetratricopeptide repeat protein [Pyrinomonadaceae bacterium]
MKSQPLLCGTSAALLLVSFTVSAAAQSGATRPRRVSPEASTVQNPQPGASPLVTTPRTNTTTTGTRATAAAPATTSRPASAPAGGVGDTARAFELLRQQQYEAALREAKQIAVREPNNGEAWKIAGFAEFNLKRYKEASDNLARALELQRKAGEEDANTVDALGQAYVRTEQFEQALPLLVAATTRANAKPDAVLLYYRGLAEFRTGKTAEAERSFGAAVKADPKNSASHFYLGRLAYERNESDAAINALNRATQGDPRFAEAWTLLTYAYLRRAAAAGGTGPKADADNLSAVRASESLVKLRADEPAAALHAQALVSAGQFPRAVLALERFGANPNAQGQTLYLLGISYSRAKNLPKAAATLERAAAKTPDDVNVYRELGYAYEVSRQYGKALAAYERGAQLAPGEADLKESAERVRPFAK